MERFPTPQDAMESFGLYGPMLVADFGAGAGYFSIPAAQKISRDGIVYAFDIQEGPLAVLRKRAHDAHLYNIQTMRADLERPQGSSLTAECVNFVFIANILFQAEQKDQIAKEAFRILKKEGKIIIVEWDASHGSTLGPSSENRISKEAIRNLFEPLGLVLEKEFAIGDHHAGLVYKKT